MENSELPHAKAILRFYIRKQYIFLSSKDLVFCPKKTGSNRVYFSSYILSNDDRTEKEQGRFLLIHRDKLKPAIYGRSYVIQYNSMHLFAFSNSWKNCHHHGILAKWVMGSWAVIFWFSGRWEALSALFVEVFFSCIVICSLETFLCQCASNSATWSFGGFKKTSESRGHQGAGLLWPLP